MDTFDPKKLIAAARQAAVEEAEKGLKPPVPIEQAAVASVADPASTPDVKAPKKPMEPRKASNRKAKPLVGVNASVVEPQKPSDSGVEKEKTQPDQKSIEANETNEARLRQIQEEESGENFAIEKMEVPNKKQQIPEEAETLAAFGRTPEKLELEKIDAQIRELYHTKRDGKGEMIEEGILVEARKAYAEAEYRTVGIWKRLKEKLGVERRDEDTTNQRLEYNKVLQNLIDLKLQRIKLQADLSEKEQHQAMAEELQFFGMESKIKLYEAWTQATMKRESGYAKAVGFCEDFGNKYNKLPLWQKLGLGALAIGTSVATGGGVMATGMLVARRAAAGLGSFAMFEGLLEKMSQNRASKAVAGKTEQAMSEIEEKSAEERLDHLMAKLKSETSSDIIAQELQNRARGRSLRVLSSATLSLGMMFGIPALGDYLKDAYFGSEVVKNTLTENPAAVAMTGAEAPVAAVTEASTPAVYDVVKGDNTWKILDGYLTDHDLKFAGMSEGQQTYAIDALKDKLKLLSPAQLKEAGFTSGNIDKLRVGDTIDIDKLLNAADADKAITGAGKISAEAVQSIEGNNAKIATWAAHHPGMPINDTVIEHQILHPHASVSGVDVHARATFPVADALADNNHSVPPVTAEVHPVSPAEVPFDRPSITEMRRGSDWFMQIFRVDDQAGGKDWIFDKKEILSTKISDILRVESNGTVAVVENSHFNPAQAKNLQEFTSELPKTFPGGKAALSDFLKARPDISVGEYIARVAKVVPQGTRIGLYTTTN